MNKQSLSEAFFRDGAVVIKNALDLDTMEQLRRGYDFALNNPTHPSPQMLPDADPTKAKHRQGGTVALAKSKELADINTNNDYDSGTGRNFSMNMNLNLSAYEAYNKIVAHPSILETLASLWGYSNDKPQSSARKKKNPSIYLS